VILRFLRCFAAFRRLEADLAEARTTVGIERELRLRADAEAQRMNAAYEEAYRGQIEAMKILTNISVQVHIGCKPPYPEAFSLPARAPKPVSYDPVETGRVNPDEAVAKANGRFATDLIEFLNPKQSAS
jgi:hypothetical protein